MSDPAAPALNLSVDEVLTTTRSVRKRLDLDRPVPREVLMECLELALQAPTGSNSQGWQWMFVDDPDKKKALAGIYRTYATPYLDRPKPDFGDERDQQRPRVTDSAKYLNEQTTRCRSCWSRASPAVRTTPRAGRARLRGSLLPAAWSFMLALRSRGLGSAWTTLHLVGDGEQRAAEVLGIPFDRYSQGGLFPIAYTKGTDFRPARRLPAAQVTHWNSW